MTASIQWQRLDPDTVNGEKLQVTIIYSSFDKREIDALQENIPTAVVVGLSEESAVER